MAAIARWLSQVTRPKGHLDRKAVIGLAVVGCLPLVLIVMRSIAAPGAPWGDSPPLLLEPLRALGAFANRHLTFDWAPPSAQRAIAYLLMLPVSALLVAVFRLPLGIRVLGLRAILLAVAFHAIGIIPCLVLMLVVIGVVVLMHPWMRHIRLPLYARLTSILAVSAIIMLGASLAAPWLRSDTVWSVAFLPVIIMAMAAESVAKTMERDNVVTAVWRGVWTVLLALLLAAIEGPVVQLTHAFPELVLMPLVGIIVVAEFFDWRLLEHWPARLERARLGQRFWYARRPRVTIVGTQGGGRALAPAVRTALENQGFDVAVLEGDARALGEQRPGAPDGIVFNAATGGAGEARFAQVPALLEMTGVPYTGAGPLAQALLADRFALLSVLAQGGVPVPRHFLVDAPETALSVAFPASARPRGEPEAGRIIARNRRALRRAVRTIQQTYGKPAVVEETVRGRRISVALLGNETVECLPLVETLSNPGRRVCPAELDATVADRIRTVATLAYRTVGCRDYGRVDIRLGATDEPIVIDVRCAQLFARRGAFMTAAEAAGYSLATLMRRIVSDAAQRYVRSRRTVTTSVPSVPPVPSASAAAETPAAVSLPEPEAVVG